MGLPPRSDEAAPSTPPTLPGFVVDVLGVDLDAEGDWELSDIPSTIKSPSNAFDVFRLVPRSLSALDEQHQGLSCVDGLRSEAGEFVARVQSLQRQVAAHSAELALARGDMTWIEESVTVAHRHLSDAQSVLLAVERECNEYRSRLGVEEQRRDGLEALLRGLYSDLVYHTSLVDSVRGFLRQDMDRDLNVYFQAIFASVRDRAARFRFATSNVVETHSVTLLHDVLSILMHFDGRLAALDSQSSVTMFSDLLGPGEALPPS